MEHLNESWASSEGVAKSMRSNRRRDTGPELQLRRLLHAAGYRYRVDYPPLSDLKRRKADIVFTRQRLAVYVDGCFWHGCPQHATWPVANQEFWRAKLDRNRARDIETTEELERRGWTVLRIWEHIAPSDAMVLVERALSAAQPR